MTALIFIEAHGKISTWSRVAENLGLSARIVATSGHVCRFPGTLWPVGVSLIAGQAVDTLRKPAIETEERIRAALRECPTDAEIIVATDDDPEGDVIALDILRIIADHDPLLIDRCLRVRPGALTRDAVERALTRARAADGGLADLMDRAVPGRTRALSDRWMGASFTRRTRTGCGRVRAGILGSAFLWQKSPDMTRGLPETGEITFQVRSESGGLPFGAQLRLRGTVPPVLAALAQRYAGRPLPGIVRPLRSVGAAVAPRFRDVAPFNTGDALAYAERFHAIGPRAAMRGMQDAYMKGRISYPRTDNRTISEQSAGSLVQAARACGLNDVSMEEAGRHRHLDTTEGVTSHEGLYPTPRMTRQDVDRFRMLLLKPIRAVDPENRQQVEDLMVTLIARRAFEALREERYEAGVYHPDAGELTAEEVAALDGLDWTRATGRALPWSRAQLTGLRLWPLASVLVDGMMIEGLGRPSTWAAHADQVAGSGQLEVPSPGALPQPSPQGRHVLKALPRGIWSPAVCRMIEEAMSVPAPGEDPGGDITQRMRARVDAWFSRVSPEVQEALVGILKSDGAARERGHVVNLESRLGAQDLQVLEETAAGL